MNFRELLRKGDLNEEKGDKEEYQKFFKKILKKYNVESPDELSDEDKKKFYEEIDAGWKSDDEEGLKENNSLNEGKPSKEILELIKGSGLDDEFNIGVSRFEIDPYDTFETNGDDYEVNLYMVSQSKQDNNTIKKLIKHLNKQYTKIRKIFKVPSKSDLYLNIQYGNNRTETLEFLS